MSWRRLALHRGSTANAFMCLGSIGTTLCTAVLRCAVVRRAAEVYNKIDMLSISSLANQAVVLANPRCVSGQVDQLARQDHSVVISVSKELNLEGLLERIWQELDLRRVYTKKKGHFPDFADPFEA